jgi:hypothetical protein
MHLQLHIFRLQYSFDRICAAIGDISTIQCALYCKLGAKYSAHPPVYSMWTVIPRYTMQLQFRIIRLQYLTESTCVAIGDMSSIQCSLYCKHGAKYSEHPPVYALWTVVPDIYNGITAPHIRASIFNWTYLRFYWRYADISICAILQAWIQIQRTSSSLRYVTCGPGHIQCSCSSAYSGLNIQLNVSVLPLEISRPFNARYTANLVPNTAHIFQFALCDLWSRRYTM